MRVLYMGISGMVLVSLVGCDTIGIGSKRIDYRASAVQVPSLEVPPDLTTPSSEGRYKVPQGDDETVATFSDYSKGGASVAQSRAVLPEVKGVSLERNESQRWLVVNDKPENVWPVVKAFWQENGLPIKSEDRVAGVMETDWAENRARIPEGGIRSVLGKVLDSLYSSGERDKYRTRMECGKDGASTEIYITHRGMEEVLTADKNSTVWQPRTNDPEMEAIMLQRLMVRFGGSLAQAATAVAANGKTASDVSASASVVKLLDMPDNNGTIVISDAFDKSWRIVGLAIERAGLAVEDRDRIKGIYFLRPAKTENNWTDKLMFWKSSEPAKRYRVIVKDGGAACEVSATDQGGAQDNASRRMLESIYKNINQADNKFDLQGRKQGEGMRGDGGGKSRQ